MTWISGYYVSTYKYHWCHSGDKSRPNSSQKQPLTISMSRKLVPAAQTEMICNGNARSKMQSIQDCLLYDVRTSDRGRGEDRLRMLPRVGTRKRARVYRASLRGGKLLPWRTLQCQRNAVSFAGTEIFHRKFSWSKNFFVKDQKIRARFISPIKISPKSIFIGKFNVKFLLGEVNRAHFRLWSGLTTPPPL